MIRALLIDLDGVLRIWPAANNARVEAAAGLPPGSLLRAAFAQPGLDAAVSGRISDEAWRERIGAALAGEFPAADAAAAIRLWSAEAGEVNPPVLELVRACRRAARVVLVTNATSRLAADLARLGLADEFDAIINSSAVGSFKPDPAIFAAALAAAAAGAALAPGQALFVDDSPGHVAAAERLGIAGHLYRDPESLAEWLRSHGLLPAA